ncbi:hypothetical protein D0T49_06125 [Paludibacter sp. 221]|uniref:LamG-like jellyroll fold domain-containing protein n=1 Tax=Paludibacter sp. 221 TaxID=2302939 RepID=UPI0013D1D254|nr:LamG-like jellyroll fold domain-containing protein [Paludibacter sp. 221]NDV46620.1 hypothetical protein [Paludibacter sp. 221]
MFKVLRSIYLVCILAIVFSCGTKPKQVALTLAADDLCQCFDTQGGRKSVKFATDIRISIASSEPSWCAVELWESDTCKNLIIKVADNNDLKKRSAEIRIMEHAAEIARINVLQLGCEPDIVVREDSVLIRDNLNFTLSMTANVPVDLRLPNWIKEVSETGGVYTFVAQKMPLELQERAGEIIIENKEYALSVVIPVSQVQGLPRFAVISDVLVGRTSSQEKLKKRLTTLLDTGKPIDAIFIVGDLTDFGAAVQYDELLSIVGDIVPEDVVVYYMMGNSDHYTQKGEETFKSKIGQPEHQYFSIKGYPFVTMSMRGIYTDRFTQTDKDFLTSSLSDAQENYPDKPIFYFMHIGAKETVYGTEMDKGDLGSEILKPILLGYPQLIYFSGHSNYTLSDPRSINQNVFTAVNIGSGIYSRIEYGYTEGMYPPNNENVCEGIIVSVLDNGDVEVERWDAARNEEICPKWLIKAPHDGSAFTYKNLTGGSAPEFSKKDKAVISKTEDGAFAVTFPQAKDDEKVHHYIIDVLDGDKVVFQNTRFSQLYLNSRMPHSFTVKLFGLPADVPLVARIRAVDSYDNISSPLLSDKFVSQPFIPSEGAKRPFADLFNIEFGKSGFAEDISPNKLKVTTGATAPKTYFNEEYGRYVAMFENNNTQFYKVDYKNNELVKNAFFTGFALETVYMSHDLRNAAPLSGKEWEGLGIEQEVGGQIEFWAFVGDKFKKTKSSVFIEPGKYYHVVAMYDRNAAKMHLYVNGKKAGETEVPGDLYIPKRDDCHWLGIGGDTHSSGRVNYPLDGEVVLARMYGRVLTDDEIYLLYKDL